MSSMRKVMDMTTIAAHPLRENRDACTGCASCAAACPVDAINMQPDEKGFQHPNINDEICIKCELCRQVCPICSTNTNIEKQHSEKGKHQFPDVFASWHLDEDIRQKSSSGGVFTALAENILSTGGVVVGAAFDEKLIVRHAIVETPADLDKLRGSKYVQSELSPVLYRKIRDLLNQNRTVLFSGTPCQVAGLKSQLTKAYDNLFSCDIICFGVPSPRLFDRYVQENLSKGDQMINVSFRYKIKGWKQSCIRRDLQNGRSKSIAISADSYMLAFLRGYALRKSCYSCKFKNTKRYSDLTLGDFWGVAKKYPQYDLDDKGTSLVLVNTKKGQSLLESCKSRLFLGPADLDTAVAGNPMLVRPCRLPPERSTFYHDLERLSFQALIIKYRLHLPPLSHRILATLKRRIRNAVRKLI